MTQSGRVPFPPERIQSGRRGKKTFARQLKEKSFRVNTNEFASTAQNIAPGLQY